MCLRRYEFLLLQFYLFSPIFEIFLPLLAAKKLTTSASLRQYQQDFDLELF